MKRLHQLVWIALAAIATACSGANPPSVSAPRGSTPSVHARLKLHVIVPKKHRRVRRHGHWISPNTQSLQFSILTSPAGVGVISNDVVNLTPSSPNCTSSPAGTSCTMSVQIAPGSYTISLATYDGTDADGNTLSQAQQVPFTVHASQTNQVNLTLDGVPYGLTVSSVAPAVTGTQVGGYTIYGTTAQTLVVNAVDPHGSTIVGAGAPRYSAAFTSGGWASPAPTGSPNINQFAVTPLGTNGATATLHVTASFSDSSNACTSNTACATDISLKNDVQTMFALVPGATATRYSYGSTIGTALAGLLDPVTMGFDSSSNLLVGDCGMGPNNCGPSMAAWSVATYLCCAWTAAPEQQIGGLTNQPISIFTCANAGNQANILGWSSGNNVSHTYETTGVWSAPAAIANTQGLPLGAGSSIAISSPTCTAAFAFPYAGSTSAYATTYSSGAWSALSPLLAPAGGGYTSAVSADPNGNLILSQRAVVCGTCFYQVEVLDSPLFTNTATLNLTSSTAPGSAQADAFDDLFVLSQDATTISIYAPPYTASPVTVSKVATASAYAIDGQGDLWVAWTSSGPAYEIDEYAPPYTAAAIATITQTGAASQILFSP